MICAITKHTRHYTEDIKIFYNILIKINNIKFEINYRNKNLTNSSLTPKLYGVQVVRLGQKALDKIFSCQIYPN